MQWVINIYVLMSASLQILGGRLGDTYSHRNIFLFGCGFFIVSSLGAGLSFNEVSLIIFRTLQGIALGISFPSSVVLAVNSFPLSQKGMAMSILTTTMGISLSVGPILGGFFVHYLTWRWIFFINIPIGLLSFFLAAAYCERKKGDKKRYIDYKGCLFLLLGLLACVAALNQLQIWGFNSVKFWAVFGFGVLMIFILYFICKNQNYPIFEFKLFKIKNFSLNNVLRLIVRLQFVPILFFLPLYLQNIINISPFNSGLVMLVLTLSIALFSVFAGKWIDRVGDKAPNGVSMALFLVGGLCTLFSISLHANYGLLIIGLICIGVATGISFVSTVTGSIHACPNNQHGIASGMIFTTAWLGCALGIAVMVSILSMNGTSFFNKELGSKKIQISLQQSKEAKRVITGVASSKLLMQKFSNKKLKTVVLLARESFCHGFKVALFYFSLLAAVGIMIASFLDKVKIEPSDHELPPPIG